MMRAVEEGTSSQMNSVDTLADKLHSLGWSFGWHGRYQSGGIIWQVDARRGEELVIVSAGTLEQALAEVVRQVEQANG
jgi:hypothetical protein